VVFNSFDTVMLKIKKKYFNYVKKKKLLKNTLHCVKRELFQILLCIFLLLSVVNSLLSGNGRPWSKPIELSFFYFISHHEPFQGWRVWISLYSLVLLTCYCTSIFNHAFSPISFHGCITDHSSAPAVVMLHQFIFRRIYIYIYIYKVWEIYYSPTPIIPWITTIIHSVYLFFFLFFYFFFSLIVYYVSFCFFSRDYLCQFYFFYIELVKKKICNFFHLKYCGLLRYFSTWFFYFYFLFSKIIFIDCIFFNIELIENIVL